MILRLLTVRIQFERDVVVARQRTRQLAEALGFDTQQQTRLATAVSEIARNAFSYGGGGRVDFSVEGAAAPQMLSIVVTDEGPGIANVTEILEGRYRSKTGMGVGMVGAQRLMDRFHVRTAPGKGTLVTLGKLLPRTAPLASPATLPRLLQAIEKHNPKDLLDEFREQNQELLRTLEELRARQDELSSLNKELEDTNRGVVALYAELDEKAESLRRADETKTRFFSNMSHEFRTPLNSIGALARLLLERTDGPLTEEQETQVKFIRESAQSLSELVNDLLDLAKVEAGKTDVKVEAFEAANLFGALRGMLRPLLNSPSLELIFEEPRDIPIIFSDEGKVAQVLRNFISNALKFTPAGEVHVSAAYSSVTGVVTFSVRDTGIGIAPEDRETIFLEFAQIDSPLQQKVKGTGLGLPLSKRLAQLLGGDVAVAGEPGGGSLFTLSIPLVYSAEVTPAPLPELPPAPDCEPVLLLEDHYGTRLEYEKHLRGSRWRVVSARSVREAEASLSHSKPRALVVDVSTMHDEVWSFLTRAKTAPGKSRVGLILAAAEDDRTRAAAIGVDVFLVKPFDSAVLRDALARVVKRSRTVLIVDDEDVSRYLNRQLFAADCIHFKEARNGKEAIIAAKAEQPNLILLDLAMAEMDGFETLKAMHRDPELKNIPVVVVTSSILEESEQMFLQSCTLAVFSKATLFTPDTADRLHEVLRNAGMQDLVERPTGHQQ